MHLGISNTAVTLSGLAALTLSASFASAAFVGVTGTTTLLGSPPVNCGFGQMISTTVMAWDEQQNVPLSLIVDMTNNPGSSGSPIPGAISGVYSSHFLHFDGSTGVASATGTATFTQPIVAVIFRPNTLAVSDGPAGAPTTIYPTGYPLRGIGTTIPSFFTISGNVISFTLGAAATVGEISQVRVITQAPTPGSVAVLGLAGFTCLRRRR